MAIQDSITIGDLHFPDDDQILLPNHRRSLLRGRYEKTERMALSGLLKPSDRVLELGAGIGYMSTIMARDHNVSAVLSFDANPLLIPFVEQVHKLNGVSGRAQIRHGLISAKPGDPVNFHIRGDFLASSLFDDRGSKFGGVKKTISVPSMTFASVQQVFEANILVCDIEGAEVELLPQINLDGFDAAVVELHQDTIGLEGVKSIIDAFSAQNMTVDLERSSKAVLTFRKVSFE